MLLFYVEIHTLSRVILSMMTYHTRPLTCQHAHRTVPSVVYVKAEGSQEIVGEATLRVCLDCGQAEGVVSNGSHFNPSGMIPITVPPYGNLGYYARKSLVSS